MFCKCFILRVTTYYLQHVVFNILKHLKKCFANILQQFCQCFSVKHLQNIFRGGYMYNKTLKHFCKCFANVLFHM